MGDTGGEGAERLEPLCLLVLRLGHLLAVMSRLTPTRPAMPLPSRSRSGILAAWNHPSGP